MVLNTLEKTGGQKQMQILTIANMKGGSGKTATAAAIAQAGAAQGLRVLAVDLDPQANLTFTLGGNARAGGSYELIEGQPARQIIQETRQSIDLISASKGLATVTTTTGSAKRLQRALQPIKGLYDLIIIDTPPTAGELQYNALQASTGIIIPLQADIYHLQGLYQIHDTAQQFKRSNPELTEKGYILTRHNARSNLAKAMQESIESKAAALNIPFIGAIREGIALREAIALQQSLYEYAPNSKPAIDYMQAFNKIMEV